MFQTLMLLQVAHHEQYCKHSNGQQSYQNDSLLDKKGRGGKKS